ncbi:hypothetical protein TNCV_2509141 [Trichonephila clavipes]|nr:hypothetical protein TNCV_2509141 [Trichonephila clavipes]
MGFKPMTKDIPHRKLVREISHGNTPNSNFSTIFTNVIQIANDEVVDKELLARAYRAALPALRKLSHPDDKACEIFQTYVALKNGRNNLISDEDLNAVHKTWNNTRSNNLGFRLKRIIQNYPNARIVAPYTPTHINSRSWPGNFRFLLKNKPLPIPASSSKEHLDVAIGWLGENISEALVAASNPKFKNRTYYKSPPDIPSKIRHRNRVRRFWQRSTDPALKNELRTMSNEIASDIRHLSRARWEKTIEELSPETGTLWRRTSFLKKTFHHIP